ncbi:DMT family transporter [Candidatus Curtissbacteria bacterium]|nr:DMT family transporter [Candidatus Curtissbacteria bacterium]
MTLFLLLLAAVAGGLNPAVVKYLANQFSPFTFITLRFVLAVLVLLPIAYKRKWIKWKNFNKEMLITNILFAGNTIIFTLGIKYTSVIVSQVVYLMTPLLVAVIGFLIIKEKLTKIQFIGLIISLAGTGFILESSFKSPDLLSNGTLLGNLLMAAADLCWAIYLVMSKKIGKSYTPLQIIFNSFAVTALIAIVISPFLFDPTKIIGDINLLSASALIFAVLVSSIGFFFLYQVLLTKTSVFTTSLLSYLTVGTTTLFGALFYKEHLTPNIIFGCLLVSFGVIFAATYKHAYSFIKNK